MQALITALGWLSWLLIAAPFGLLYWLLAKRQKSQDEFHFSNEYQQGPPPWGG